jgi:8-oxo-dGTP diphosphatase
VSTPPSSSTAIRAAAGALFVDDAGRVLLVHPTYKPGWDVPGGWIDPGESPAAACRRELREELGLDRPPRRLLCVDWAPDEGGDRLLFLFACDPIGDDEHRIVLQAEELDDRRWVAPADLDDHAPARLARRVRACLDGAGPYLEHGAGTFSPGAGG